VNRLLQALLVAFIALGASSCQAVARVTVAQRAAGDGIVSVRLTLDRAAAAQFPNLAQQLRLGDLQRAGWTISGPETSSDGSSEVTVSRPFADAAGAQVLLREVAAPLGGLRLERKRSVLWTRTAVVGTVDLRAGADALADPQLAAQLGSPSLSSALAALHQAGGADPGLRLELATALPGQTKVWPAALGQTLTVTARARALNGTNAALLAVALLSVLALGAVALHRLGFGRRRGHRHDSWTIATPPRRWR
jgi:hypothetical protein